MRSIRPLLFALALLPAAAGARAWQGITPGQSTRADVVARFGEPSTAGKLGERTALVYKGDQALAGTRQAQFFVGEDGIVAEVTVFPSAQLDKESVDGTYGNSAHKTFTDDFRPVWHYRGMGVVVFFGKDGFVDAITFRPGEGAARQAGTAAPARGPEPTPRAAPSTAKQPQPSR